MNQKNLHTIQIISNWLSQNTKRTLVISAFRFYFLSLFLICGILGNIYSNNIKVPSQYTTIQLAIDAAFTGDTILVSPGTYKENINFKGKDIVVGSLFLTTGNGDHIKQTVIDGNQKGSVVTFDHSETLKSKLIGFTITNGINSTGGGIYCKSSSPTLTNLIVAGNKCGSGDYGYGGGVYCDASSPVLENILIYDNTIIGGFWSRYGAGISLWNQSNATIRHSTIVKNTIDLYRDNAKGSGLFCYNSSPQVENSIIAYNINGQGISNIEGGSPSFKNCCFWQNIPDNFYGCSNELGKNVAVNIRGDSCDLAKNIIKNPEFESIDEENFKIKTYSHCTATGALCSTDFDLFGNQRPLPSGSMPDMGAYESPQGFPPTPGIFEATPNTLFRIQNEAWVEVLAYPVRKGQKVWLIDTNQKVIFPDSVKVTDSLRMQLKINIQQFNEETILDLYMLNGKDTLCLKKAITILDAETPFNVWSEVEIESGKIKISSVKVPKCERLYVFVKKTSRTGFTTTWKGELRLLKDGKVMASAGEAATQLSWYHPYMVDFEAEVVNAGAGAYTFEIENFESDHLAKAEILFTDHPSELTLNKWGKGEILRPYGMEWKKFTVPENTKKINIKTEGFGYAQVEILKNSIQYPAKRWFYTGDTYSIENPEAGAYFIKYLETGVVDDQDQQKEIMFYVGTEAAPSSNRSLSIESLSTYSVGRGSATIDITGIGFSENDIVKLVKEDSVYIAETIYKDDRNIIASFELAEADTGKYELFINNTDTIVTASQKVQIVPDSYANIETEIIGRDKMRKGFYQTYIIRYTNTGNANSYLTPFVIRGIPNDADVQIVTTIKNVDDAFEDWKWNYDPDDFEYPPIYQDDDHKTKEVQFIPANIPPGTTKDFEFKIKPNSSEDINLSVNVRAPLVADGGLSDCMKQSLIALGQKIVGAKDPTGISGCLFAANDFLEAAHKEVYSDNIYSGVTVMAHSLNTVFNCAGIVYPPAKIVGTVIGTALDIKQLSDIAETCHTSDDIKKLIELVTSVDPSDKYCTTGATTIHDGKTITYIDSLQTLEYRIDFWNKETATAPVLTATVIDTLDTDLDISTFNFTEAGYKDWKIKLNGGRYFNITFDCRPAMPYFLNVCGDVDTTTRVATITYTTLDTLTLDLPEDPMAGYMPAITSAGDEISWVSYTINPVEEATEETEFTNKAWIEFDNTYAWEDAPHGNPTTSLYDLSSPVSSVLELPQTTNADSVLIHWLGSDPGCGLITYTIYVSINGSTYAQWLTTTDTLAWYKGEYGNTYSFYSVATDFVGNQEAMKTNYEARTKLSDNLNSGSELVINGLGNRGIIIAPNPNDGLFTVSTTFKGESQLTITTLSGQKIYGPVPFTQSTLVNLTSQSKGFYLCVVKNANQVKTQKIEIE